MPPQNDDAGRLARPRANTSGFSSFSGWRRGRQEAVSTPTTGPSTVPTLPLEALIEALTPPAVPSLNHARHLATALSSHTSTPKLANLSPVLASLCCGDSPVLLQAAGYDILAAYLDNSSAVVLTTADRLACLSLFLNPTVPWTSELWEPRYRALRTLIRSGEETVGMEGPILTVLKSWIEGAFGGLIFHDSSALEERPERQRCVQVLTEFLTSLLGIPEFASRISERDTTNILELWSELIDQAMSSGDYYTWTSPTSSPVLSPQLSRAATTPKTTYAHRRHHSSTSIPQVSVMQHPADMVVEAFLEYLSIRLRAIASTHLKFILPLLFRTLTFYATPFPRISLVPNTPRQHPIEVKIFETLQLIVTGPFSTSCTILLKHFLFPSADCSIGSIQTSIGALKTLRHSIRRSLINRLVRNHITRASMESTPSGAPTHIDLERGLMERAWAKDDTATWDLIRFRNILCRAVKAWAEKDHEANTVGSAKEAVLNEVALLLKDVLQTLDQRGDDGEVDDEEVEAFGDVLQELVAYVRLLRTSDGSLVPLSLTHPDVHSTQSSLLYSLTSILSQDLMTSALYPVLPLSILSIAGHIADADIAQVLTVLSERQALTPTSPIWLDHWELILKIPNLYGTARPLTREIAMTKLGAVWEFVKDIPVYRRPLAELVFDIWSRQSTEGLEDSFPVIWSILSDEIVLRSIEELKEESTEGESYPTDSFTQTILEFLIKLASEKHDEDEDTASIRTADTYSPTPQGQFSSASSTVTSPSSTRLQSDHYPAGRDKESTILSLFSSLTSGNSSRAQSQPRRPPEQPTPVESPPLAIVESTLPRSVGAVMGLISTFSQLAFSPLVLSKRNVGLAMRVYHTLLDILAGDGAVRARLTILQFMMRLRVDRDHRLYLARENYDKDGNIGTLAGLINRTESSTSAVENGDFEIRTARPLASQERDGRRSSRGRGRHPSTRFESSRSRSRVPPTLPLPTPVLRPKARDPLWSYPESLNYALHDVDTPSEELTSYDPASPGGKSVLPLSVYLSKLVTLIRTEKEWEILSYVLCHLPTQLANKHLFCGPKSRVVIAELLNAICTGISEETLGSSIERWPDRIIARDAHGLAFRTLTVLISYKSCFKELHIQHQLVQVFLIGLNGQPSTIKCCLHALSLAAFELQPSMTKFLPQILEKLSQIMSNPAMAVHIIDFLAIVGSLKALHANFTEDDHKMVFGVALQYLQHHNRHDESLSISWALSQHVRIMSYYIVYLWFLAVKLPDRPQHVSYIARQIQLANSEDESIDEPAEVCFDWLARYTYASADPRPAHSMLSDIVMNPTLQRPSPEPAITEKTWIMGNSVVTIRALARRGWVEVLSRRASGLTKFICRTENVPVVPLGDVDPDSIFPTAMLTMDRGYNGLVGQVDQTVVASEAIAMDGDAALGSLNAADRAARPDPITGYVWSGTAPSQRRKDVAIDPAFFALQLSPYPDSSIPRGRLITDSQKLGSFFRSLDRMPVIDTHKVGVMYVAPGQHEESEILRNTHGSPAYSRFLEGLGRLIDLRGQVDVYAGGLDPDEDGEYAYAWWDDIGQVLFHTATLMPTTEDRQCTNKKRHIGNDYVRIVWNDSGMPYRFDTLGTQFQYVNIVVEPHSRGAIAAFSDSRHENEYFKVIVQRAPGMTEFTPIGDFKLISAENLPLLVRQLSLLADWFVSVFQQTEHDTVRNEIITNWRSRLQALKQFRSRMLAHETTQDPTNDNATAQQNVRDFTTAY